MKITKQRLKEIIKEELSNVLSEEEQSPEVAEFVDTIHAAKTEQDFEKIHTDLQQVALYAHERSFLWTSLGRRKEQLGLTPYSGAVLGHEYGPKVDASGNIKE
jgi:RecG-like helicase